MTIRIQPTFGFAILGMILLIGCGDLNDSDQLKTSGEQLLACSAFFNVVGLQLPDQIAIDQEALMMRDFFADYARLYLEASFGHAPSDLEMNNLISTALEKLETMHRNNAHPEAMLPECLAWQVKILNLTEAAGLTGLDSMNRSTVRQHLIISDAPSDSDVERVRADTPAELTAAARRAFRLWGNRGYMTPRKAAETLGIN